MQYSMQRQLHTAGLKHKDAHSVGHLTPAILAGICRDVITEILTPGKFDFENLAVDAEGKSTSVFGVDMYAGDLLGWITRVSYLQFWRLREGRKSIGHPAAMFIDSMIRTLSEDKERLMSVGEKGADYSVRWLRLIAQLLDKCTQLPELFPYAKDSNPYEMSERARRRLEARTHPDVLG